METKNKKMYLVPIVLGIVLIIAGLVLNVPGGALTTHSILNGEHTDGWAFDNKYSAIDEYVGGDAYNFIIGASLVSGKMAGMIMSKTICIVGGAICICIGLLMMSNVGKENNEPETSEGTYEV